jgi:hypothetical protein
MGDNRNLYNVLLGIKKEKDNQEDRDVDETIILEWILKILDGVLWAGLIWFNIGTSGGLL